MQTSSKHANIIDVFPIRLTATPRGQMLLHMIATLRACLAGATCKACLGEICYVNVINKLVEIESRRDTTYGAK